MGSRTGRKIQVVPSIMLLRLIQKLGLGTNIWNAQSRNSDAMATGILQCLQQLSIVECYSFFGGPKQQSISSCPIFPPEELVSRLGLPCRSVSRMQSYSAQSSQRWGPKKFFTRNFGLSLKRKTI